MQALNPLAIQLNEELRNAAPSVFALLSELGKRIYLPKGILSQTTEANAQAHQFNATRAIALDFSGGPGDMMHLPASRRLVPELTPESVYGYAPVLGQQALREAWRTHILRENPSLSQKMFSHPIVTSGMTHGFSLLAELFADRGDVLILPDQIWGNYRLIFQTKAGADIQTYPFFNASSGFNVHGFRQTLTEVTDEKLLVLLNFPHNPTGYTVTLTEAQQIVKAIVARAETGCHILVMVDDAYAGLWYDETVMHESLFGLLAGCHPNVVPVKIDGATKEEYAWGLRVAFITFGLDVTAMQPLEQKLSGLIRANISGASQVSQTLILAAMKAPGYAEQKQCNYETLKARALKVQQIASEAQYARFWAVYPSHAGYFICLRLKSGNAETVRQRLLEEHGLGVIALGETELRIAYSCLDESGIETVFAIIAKVIEEL